MLHNHTRRDAHMYNYAQLSVLARIRRVRVKSETLSFLFIAIMNSDQRFIHK